MLARMMAVVKTPGRIVLLALLLAISIGPDQSWAADEARDEKNRWIPAIGISSGLFVQRYQAVINTSDIAYRDVPIQPGAPIVGRERTLTPFIAVNLELTTPSLIDSLAAPSLFAHVDFAYTFGFDQSVALAGAPGPLEPPPIEFPEEIFWKGQGAYADYKASDFQFSGGVGLVFHFDIFDRRVRLKPSLEYMRNTAKFKGSVSRVLSIESAPPEPSCPSTPGSSKFYRCIELSGEKTHVFHSLGPGLEVEVDAGRTGPLVLALYGGAQAYAILGHNAGQRVEFSDSKQYEETPEWETAEWSYLANRWFFRGSVGLRFRWVPE